LNIIAPAERFRSQAPGFSMRAWLEWYPLTSAPHNERLLEAVAKVDL